MEHADTAVADDAAPPADPGFVARLRAVRPEPDPTGPPPTSDDLAAILATAAPAQESTASPPPKASPAYVEKPVAAHKAPPSLFGASRRGGASAGPGSGGPDTPFTPLATADTLRH